MKIFDDKVSDNHSENEDPATFDVKLPKGPVGKSSVAANANNGE